MGEIAPLALTFRGDSEYMADNPSSIDINKITIFKKKKKSSDVPLGWNLRLLHRPCPLCQVHQIGMVWVSEGKKSNGIVKNHIGKLQISEIAIFQIEEN